VAFTLQFLFKATQSLFVKLEVQYWQDPLPATMIQLGTIVLAAFRLQLKCNTNCCRERFFEERMKRNCCSGKGTNK
jgi:hypothetical protein